MKKSIKKLYIQQKKRYLKKIVGCEEKPRLSVFRSHNHIYGQLINDQDGRTLAFSSTLNKSLEIGKSSDQKSAYIVGQDLAKKAKEKNITTIVFDRGNRPYHGRIRSLADGARSEGLVF
jgi:large subunit ribosomal protein L18